MTGPDPGKTKLDFLEGTASFLRRTVSPVRLGYCSRHRAEHTGKICYLSLLDLALYRMCGREEFMQEAASVAVRVAGKIHRNPHTGASIFFPGALDHRNAANHAIDSGAAVDCLATMIDEEPGAFKERELAEVREAVQACASTYLREAAFAKRIPAQRLWAGTGLAAAYALLKDESYKQAALDSISLLLKDSSEDGAIPYFPGASEMGGHVSQGDISPYYHSRCVGFAFYILDRLGEKPWPKLAAFLENALDLLAAFYCGDGLKLCLNEAKQWYWESAYEVASHSFDVHAFVMGSRILGRSDFLDAAGCSFARLDQHRGPDGGIDSHRGKGKNFQCRLFWNGHAAWVARVIEDVPVNGKEGLFCAESGVRVFPTAGLVSARRKGYEAAVRGAKKPVNISFGSTVGGGTLFRFGSRESGFSDLLKIGKWRAHVPGSFLVWPEARYAVSARVKEFLRDNRPELRFKLYIAWMELTGGRPFFAMFYPLRHVLARFLNEMRGLYASHWDCCPSMKSEGDTVVFEGAPSRRNGSRLDGARAVRTYSFDQDSVKVKDTLRISSKAKRIAYGLAPVFNDVRVRADGRIKHLPDRLLIVPSSQPHEIEVSYSVAGQPDPVPVT